MLRSKADLKVFLLGPHEFSVGNGAEHYLGDEGLPRWGKVVCARAMAAVVEHTLESFASDMTLPQEAIALHVDCQRLILDDFRGAELLQRSTNLDRVKTILDGIQGASTLAEALTGIIWSESNALNPQWSFDEFQERAHDCLSGASADLLFCFYLEMPEPSLRRLARVGESASVPKLRDVERGQLTIIPDELVPWLEGTSDPLGDRVHGS